jgi:hypothetical protein
MRRFTAPSVRQALSSALAAGHGFLMSLSGRLTKYTSGCMVPSAGIGMTIQRTSSWSGRTGLKQVGRREPGSTSIMITMPMRQRTRLQCGACSAAFFGASTGKATSNEEDQFLINTYHWQLGRRVLVIREMSPFEVPAKADMRWSSGNFAL